jgi:GGDEF domain-containing protein
LDPLELVVWSMALGAIAAVGLARAVDLAVRPSLAQLRDTCFHAAVFVVVLLLCGVLTETLGAPPRWVHAAQVLVGPVAAGVCNFWIRGWLGANQRDRLMATALRASAWLAPAAGCAAFALPTDQQLPAAAGITLLGSAISCWLAVRAWLMGDRLAPIMAMGCFLSLPSLGVLYAVAMDAQAITIGWQALGAGCTAIANGMVGFVMWRRDRHEWKTERQDGRVSQFDPVTRLHSGIAIVRKMVKAQRRRRRTRRDGALIAILVFDVDQVSAQVGTAGVNEMFIAIASRVQRQVGVVNPVGRYWDRCFICIVETIHSPAWLRTLGLRVSTSLRRPIEVTGLDGQRTQVRADVGVGVVHIAGPHMAVEDILHDAQRMAEAARHMPSRAAMLDPDTGEVVAVEMANLGPRRAAAGHRHHVPHAVAPLQRTART